MPGSQITPSLVIGLGNLGQKVAEAAVSDYLSANLKREYVTRLLFFTTDAQLTPPTRKDGILVEKLVENSASVDIHSLGAAHKWLKNQYFEDLHTSLHSIFAQENFFNAGLDIGANQPANVMVVCDILEKESAVLLPVLALLREVLHDYPYARLFILAATARFPEKARKLEELGKVLNDRLNELSLILDKDKERQLTKEFPQLKEIDFHNLPIVFLYDHLKFGSVTVENQPELLLMMRNSLQNLLLGKFAQEIAVNFRQNEIQAEKTFFHSMGSVILSVNSREITLECVSRFVNEFINEELLTPVYKPDVYMRIRDGLDALARSDQDRAEWIVKDSLGKLIGFDEYGPQLDVKFSDLVLKTPNIIQLSASEWRETISRFKNETAQKKLNENRVLFEKNRTDLMGVINADLSEELVSLPSKVELYPGGINLARKLLQEFIIYIQKRIETTKQFAPQELSEAWESQIDSDLQAYESILASAPNLPNWVFFFPMPIRWFLGFIVRAKWAAENFLRIRQIRNAILIKIEKQFSSDFTIELNKQLTILSESVKIPLDEFIGKFQDLEAIIISASEKGRDTENQGSDQDGMETWDPIFRPKLLDNRLLDWVYKEHSEQYSLSRIHLISEKDLFKNWMELDSLEIYKRIEQYAESLFLSIEAMPLEELLNQWSGLDSSRSVEELFRRSANAAIPLLRPTFERVGGMRTAPLRTICLPNTESDLAQLQVSPDKWGTQSTGDNFTAAFSQILFNIPLNALNHH